jgi:CRISPR-associated endonuclease/helicase Cas3
MTPDDFAPFYEAVHGRPPFPWQTRLARRVAERGWPAVLALPTASGKTSAIDVAVFTLALQSGRPLRDRTAPVRTFFVIDRRLVVDQAARHARELRAALEDPGDRPLVRRVAEALGRFGGAGPLHVAALRGGMYRDDGWARAPNQPTVCVSTVDQVGSRLLFRGYGVSPYAQPLHAALVGNDALYLVDEAHLSQPFLETLRAVQGYRGGPLGGPFHVVEASATPQSQGDRFDLGDDDHANAELSRRLNTPKPARLEEPARFEAEAAEWAARAVTGDVRVVGVVVNRVASARDIFDRLPGEPFEDRVLLTGRIRPWDRDELLCRCLGRMRAGRARAAGDRPLFIVATMTVEVGADLDFDHLVTEAATLPALRQRFGRLDRLGRFGQGAGVILLRKGKGPDPIYGDDLARTWDWLKGRGGAIDFGIKALEDLIRGAGEPPPEPAPRHGPMLFPAHLDAWVQTSPAPVPSPDVAPFLHGAEALEAADVQVVWRADLRSGEEQDWLATVAVAPPRSREALPLPVGAVRSWLSGRAAVEVADIEGAASESKLLGAGRPALRWCGPDEAQGSRVVGPDDVRPGDTLVVPSGYGGADAFGWKPQSREAVADVGDLCFNDMANAAPGDGKRLVRLRLPDVGDGQSTTLVRELRGLLEQGEDSSPALQTLLADLVARPPASPQMQAVVGQLAAAGPRATPYPAGVMLTARVRPGFFRPDSAPPDEDDDGTDVDDTSSLRGGTYPPAEVGLVEHIAGVVRWARSLATSLGVDEHLRAALERAAHLHDIGKADWRFQYLLYGDEPGEALLAKSAREWDPNHDRMVRKRAGLPDGFRHEFVSVALLRNHAGQLLGDLTQEQRALVDYLVGTHHGRGRPFVPVIEERAPELVTLSWGGHALSASSDHGLWRLDSRWADGFWALVRRYGHWGLAYLEALLRLADAARSAEEQRQGEDHRG